MTSSAKRLAQHPASPAAPVRPSHPHASKINGLHGFAGVLSGLRAPPRRGKDCGAATPHGGGKTPARDGAPPQAVEPPRVGGRPHHDRRDSSNGGAPHDPPAPLDPLTRHLAFDRPLPAAPAPVAPPPNAPLLHVEQLVARLVRRVAWGGDGRRGAARIEVGAGELAGATITVESCGRELSIDVDLPPGVAADAWRERIAARLRARGFDLASLEVR